MNSAQPMNDAHPMTPEQLATQASLLAVDSAPLPAGMIDRHAACAMFGVAIRAWMEWERQGRITCGKMFRNPGKPGQRKLYPIDEITRLAEEHQRRYEPYPDPERPGCYRVPIISKMRKMEAIIDESALPLVKGRRWNFSPGHQPGQGCVIVAMPGTPKPALHQIVMGVSGRSVLISHLNGDPLDCRRENLVLRSHREMGHARAKMTSRRGEVCSSRFKGVTWTDDGKKWSATITAGAKRHQLGRFRCEIDAAEAYDAAARELFGEHARLNLPDLAEAARLRAENPLPPIDTTWPPPGMVDRYEACRMFDISTNAWLAWERKGRITCGQFVPNPNGTGGRSKIYPLDELERLRVEFAELGKPYPDPDRSGCYRVPLKSYLCYREAIIGAVDLPVVEGRNWNWDERADGHLGCVILATVNGPHTPLHRLIAGAEGNDDRVRFANRDPLDCRRENIVVQTLAEQVHTNRKMGTVSGRKYTSIYKGVSWSEPRGKWVAQISKGDLHRNLGRFDDEITAAQVYDNAARELFGDHAHFNFPDEPQAQAA